MDEATRRALEQRAYSLWEEAGRPDGSGLHFWLQAEQELGIVPRVERSDPFVTLHELAVAAREREAESAAGEEARDPAGDAPNTASAAPRAQGWVQSSTTS